MLALEWLIRHQIACKGQSPQAAGYSSRFSPRWRHPYRLHRQDPQTTGQPMTTPEIEESSKESGSIAGSGCAGKPFL